MPRGPGPSASSTDGDRHGRLSVGGDRRESTAEALDIEFDRAFDLGSSKALEDAQPEWEVDADLEAKDGLERIDRDELGLEADLHAVAVLAGDRQMGRGLHPGDAALERPVAPGGLLLDHEPLASDR